MGENRCVSLQQATRYASTLVKDGDYISAIKFTGKATTEVLPTTDKKEFAEKFRINGMANNIYGNGTNILLALDSALAVLNTVSDEYKKIVFLFTDGESNMSRLREITNKFVKNKCIVFPICYGQVDMRSMNRIANATFGRSFKIKKVRDFAAVFTEVYNELSNFYRVVYQPPECPDLHIVTINTLLPIIQNNRPTKKVFNVETRYDKSMFAEDSEIGTMQLIDIEFEFGKTTIDPNFIHILDDIASQLERNSSVKILIVGHTDNVGNPNSNQKLSEQRAISIKNYLVSKGISRNRIETKGYGMTRPLVDNDTDHNRKKNRRTEFIIIE
jgi:outer membrane protein OmpA-like peptidoglycan-associated protein/uncharacterized protein YegL